jgi:parvulin-like peptidyl-prolyl isomerase
MMATKKKTKKISPRVHAVKEQKKLKTLITGFIITGVVIVGLIAYAVIYSVFIKDNIAVATVNGEKIDNEYFKARVRLQRNDYLQQFVMLNVQAQIFAEDPNQASYYQDQMMQISAALDNVVLFGEQVLKTIIEEEVIAIKGREMGLEISDAEIDALVKQIFNYFPEGTPTPAPTIAPFVAPPVSPTQVAILGFKPTVAADPLEIDPAGGIGGIGTSGADEDSAEPTGTPGPTATPYTEELFQTTYNDYVADLKDIKVSEKHFRTFLYYYLMRVKVQEAVFANVPTEQDQVWARHILVPNMAEALAVLDRLENGEAWADIAADVSLDTSNKDNGGDLGWFSAGQMVAAFNDAVFALQIGEISEPVETQFGWHIIQLVDRAVLPLSARDLQAKQNLAYNTWMAEAMESVPYEINDVYRDITPADPSIADFIAAQQTQAVEEPAQ